MQSERHLTGIKSVFGGLRNYFSGRNAAAAAGAATATSTSGASTVKSESSSSYASEAREASGLDYGDSERLDYMRRENHPGTITRVFRDIHVYVNCSDYNCPV